MEEQKKTKKDKNCLHCIHIFDCDGHPIEVTRCVNYEERKDEDE